jgi:hypothetical protein
VAAVEEYARCRQLLGDVPLMAAIQEFVRRNRGVQLGVKVPDLIAEFVKAKAEDNLSRIYRFQLSGSVKRFAAAFPGEILIIKSGDIDRWLRSLNHTPVTRNSLHRCIKVFFSFAKSRGQLSHAYCPMAEGRLYCSDLLMPFHADGVVYYFGILFDKKFRPSNFIRGLIEVFRCSLNALIPH